MSYRVLCDLRDSILKTLLQGIAGRYMATPIGLVIIPGLSPALVGSAVTRGPQQSSTETAV